MSRIRKDQTLRSIQEPFWKIGLYIRLSREDENPDASESIVNQQKILRDFVNSYFQPNTYTIVDVFCDDGMTGTDTARPDFRRLESSIISKEVNCMIIKSLARGFRNLADQQKFLDEFIPIHGARFICTSAPFIDTYADPHSAYGLEVPIRGMFNEQFAAATSEEIRKTFRMKRERGEFIGAFAAYGYKKDPHDKNHLLIDEDAAEVVKNIYHWFVNEGYSKRGIAKRLNQLEIPNPQTYKKKKGLKYKNPNSGNNDGLWSASTITRILQNQIYTGMMVQGRHRIISYKVHKQISVPPEEWFMVPNTHTAIIDENTFAKAQALHMYDTRTAPGKGKVYLLSGLVRCADCRKAMHRKTARNITYYFCRSYSDKKVCSKHSIRQDKLENILLSVLQTLLTLTEGFTKEITNIKETSDNQKTQHLYYMLRQTEKRLEQYDDISDSTYLDWKKGELTIEEYRRLKNKIEEQVQQLTSNVSYLKSKIRMTTNNQVTDESYLDLFLKSKNIPYLTRGIIVELIKNIWIHENGEITIDFNFSDEYQNILKSYGSTL